MKYLKSVTGTAYAGIEKTAKWYAKLNGIQIKGKNVEMIKDGLRIINMKVLRQFVSFRSAIHIDMYYEHNAKVNFVNNSLEDAKESISYLKPITIWQNIKNYALLFKLHFLLPFPNHV